MPKSSTFTVTRVELRRILVAFGMSEKNIQNMFTTMEKSHRHINAISFASILEKTGMNRNTAADVFRRLGMDDIAVSALFNMVDEEKITAETGRLYNATIDFS